MKSLEQIDNKGGKEEEKTRKKRERHHLFIAGFASWRGSHTLQGSLPGQDGVVGTPGPPAPHVSEAGGGQERAVLGGGPLAALRLHQHVQWEQHRGQGAPPVRVQEALDDQDAATCRREGEGLSNGQPEPRTCCPLSPHPASCLAPPLAG